jgi:hypothetical protein
MNRFFVLAFTALVLCLTAAFAQDKLPGPKAGPISMTAISPIFGELVAFSLPANFRTVHESANANGYIREAVLAGETVQRWTQMITVTGHKGMAANPAAMPQRFANLIAAGFNKACPETFSGSAFGDTKIDGHDAYVVVVACGNVKAAGDERSETALIMAIKGVSNYYTLQWAERGRAIASAPKIDAATWTLRADALQPVRLCTIVPGEKAPYPSCIGPK